MTRGIFSLVVAVHNVAPYVDDFLRSVEQQTFPHEHLDIVFVDDGSTDDSLQKVTLWATGREGFVTVLRQPNKGQGAARNLGLAHARHPWVTFCDPDDVLAPDYFAQVHQFMQESGNEQVSMYASRLLELREATGSVTNTHPLRHKFARGNRVVNLDTSPSLIHLSGGTSFLRRSELERRGLRFDEQLRPNFEDAALIARYLLDAGQPTIGYVATADYHYRHRSDATGSVRSSLTRDEKYTVVPDRGYLATLRYAVERDGAAPLWVQNLVLYDLLWYFRADAAMLSPTKGLDPRVLERFHTLVRLILQHVSKNALLAFQVMPTSLSLKRALLYGYMDPDHRPDSVLVDKLDAPQRLARMRYHYGGELPVERLRLNRVPVAPRHCKSVHHVYFGRTLYSERICWVSARGTLQIELDGEPMPLTVRPQRADLYQLRPKEALGERTKVGQTQHSSNGESRPSIRQRWSHEALRESHTRRYLTSRRARHEFHRAWVLMDRLHQANDNAEHLYRYLLRRHPKVNAWFVLRRDCPDWARLERDGFRLLEYGSKRWAAALLNAEHYVSSQLERYVVRPQALEPLGRGTWRFTWLQHGVIKDDLSRWVNEKPVDLFVTSTPAEYESIAGDGPYRFSSKEVRLTGLPRHDTLLDLAKRHRTNPGILLVMPTWRRYLMGTALDGGSRWQRSQHFEESSFARHWSDLLQSPRLREISRSHGMRVVLLPHPNLDQYARDLCPSPEIEVASWADPEAQQLVAEAGVLVTDYSSIAFDAAYLQRPVVYFQFDRQEMAAGHTYVPGYFDYERDGFGPVTRDAGSALDEVCRILENEGLPDPLYAERMLSTFPLRDGKCCRRVVKAIKRLNKRDRAPGGDSSRAPRHTEDASATRSDNGSQPRRAAADSTRSSGAVRANRTCRTPADP